MSGLSKFLEEQGRRLRIEGNGPPEAALPSTGSPDYEPRVKAAAEDLAAVLAAGEAQKLPPQPAAEMPGPNFGGSYMPALPGPATNPALSPDLRSPIEDNLLINPEQAQLLRQQLLQEAFTGDSSAARIKAIQVLLSYAALERKDRVRNTAANSERNIFNIVNLTAEARKASSQYDHLLDTTGGPTGS